jgi:hypothetical protein
MGLPGRCGNSKPRGWSIPCLIGAESLRLSVPRLTAANTINTGAFAPQKKTAGPDMGNRRKAQRLC